MQNAFDDPRLPDSDTELSVSYTYSAEDGSKVTSSLTLKGADAEHGPYMMTRFQAWLEGLGYKLGVEPPVTAKKVIKAAMILAFTTGLMQNAYSTTWTPARGRRLSVVADIPMPHRMATHYAKVRIGLLTTHA